MVMNETGQKSGRGIREKTFGMLYGIGIGPGDPELLTLKAVRLIRHADVIAFPGKEAAKSFAYRTAAAAVPEIEEKKLEGLYFPMTSDEGKLRQAISEAAEKLEGYLREGLDVAFLSIGDISIYSTYLYVQDIVKEDAFETRMVPGIPSFCAAAASLQTDLARQDGMLHIIPATGEISEAMRLPGTKVFLKAGSCMGEIRDRALERGLSAYYASKCGMKDEALCRQTEALPDKADYLSLVIVKGN